MSVLMRVYALVLVVAACRGEATRGSAVTLHVACGGGQYWDGHACAKSGDAPAQIALGEKALADLKVDEAKTALDAAERAGPLDHDTNVALWEQRGIAAAYVDDDHGARTAFDMMLALDPSHILSYTLSPKATFVFDKVRKEPDRRAPEVDVNWAHGGKVGDPVPLDVEVLSDPKQFLRRATVFVRTRGETGWRAADLALGGSAEHRIVLPAVTAQKPVSLELYLRAYDDHGNEVLTWADPARPREIPLRYDPPPPWYRKWWVIAIASSVVAIGTGITVYELTSTPPSTVGGTVTVK